MRKSLVVFLLAAIAALTLTQAGTASSTVSFAAPEIYGTYSPLPQTYTATITISDTLATDILAGYQLDLFLSTTPGNFQPVYDNHHVIEPTPNLLETGVTITGFSLNTTPAYVYNNTTSIRAMPTSIIRMTKSSSLHSTSAITPRPTEAPSPTNCITATPMPTPMWRH